MSSEVLAVVERSRDEAYWRGIAPGLGVGEERVLPELPRGERGDELGADFRREGYFRLPGLLPFELCSELVHAIGALRQRHIPPVFAFVYDEVWRIAERLVGLGEILLGGPARLLPGIWAWWIEPHAGDGGWGPHRDRHKDALRADGTPNSVSLWIALTDATPDNGCMYVIPADEDADYAQRRFEVNRVDARFARALPAAAGTVLGWNQAVLHWGGRSSAHARHPRVSLGFEVARADAPPVDLPLVDPRALSLERRLALIGKAIYTYFGHTKLGRPHFELAVHLAQRLWR